MWIIMQTTSNIPAGLFAFVAQAAKTMAFVLKGKSTEKAKHNLL